MTDTNLMTQAEYAIHRGVTEAAVSKAVSEKRIHLENGKINHEVADREWAQNTRARASSTKVNFPAVPAGAEDGAVQTSAPQPASENKTSEYWEARSRRESAEAAIAEMKEAEMRGLLIRTDAVRSAMANKISATRDALLQIPVRAAPLLAAETDIDKVTELLESEIRQALAQLLEQKQEGEI